MRTNPSQLYILTIGLIVAGCSGAQSTPAPAVGGDNGVGGSTEAGGSTNAANGGTSAVAQGGGVTGGLPSTGGNVASTGGTLATNAGGMPGTGGARTGGAPGNGGTLATGGLAATGGARTGGAPGAGGAATGGTLATNTGGMLGTGGARTGGATGAGGAATGGKAATGGAATGGKAATGGTPGTGGAPGTGGGTSTVDCSATMPTGGTVHTSNSQGGAGSLAWQYWANNPANGSMTTFSTPAFAASWNGANDFLARLGLEWGSNPQPYTSHGTITAQYTFTKTGTAGGYSYIGIYGWSTNPCIEWYIVDNSFNSMPFTPYNSSQKGSAVMIDGENYKLYSNGTTGTGGNRCGNVTSWTQFWSVRQTARTCGTITISQHFDAWNAAGLTLGNMLEAKILIETGGGNGSINFPIADVTSTQ